MRSRMQHRAVPIRAVQCHAVPHSSVQCRAVPIRFEHCREHCREHYGEHCNEHFGTPPTEVLALPPLRVLFVADDPWREASCKYLWLCQLSLYCFCSWPLLGGSSASVVSLSPLSPTRLCLPPFGLLSARCCGCSSKSIAVPVATRNLTQRSIKDSTLLFTSHTIHAHRTPTHVHN
jgi:hypothetical protein